LNVQAELRLIILAGEAELGAAWRAVNRDDLHVDSVCFLFGGIITQISLALVAELAVAAKGADSTRDNREN